MPAPDDIRRWSDALAADPASLVYADLADALRRQGDLDAAERIARRGLDRHPGHAPGLVVLARIAEDRGDLPAASEWWGRARAAETRGAPAPAPLRRASGGVRAVVRRPTPAAPLRAVSHTGTGTPTFVASFTGSRPEIVRSLVADADGLLLASPTASDDLGVLESMAAAVAGVGDDATRAAKHLGLGAWRAIVLETTADTLAIAPASDGALTVLSVARHVPLGRSRALLRLAATRAAADGF
jgi:predicted regulator of Ras-like GTPase activity (Roadblock/LC7/MglB family)